MTNATQPLLLLEAEAWRPKRSGAGRLTEALPAGAKRPETWKAWVQQSLDRFFCISERGSTIATEVRAGTTAFLATANNFIVNAHIMQHAGLDNGDSVASGAFASAFGCIASGILSNLPLGIVPSVGPNVFLAYSLVASHRCTVEQALAISTTCGLLLCLASLTPLVKLALGLVPLSVKFGLVVGTGLLTALLGLKSIGVVVPDDHDIVALGRLDTLEVHISLVVLIVTASMLHLGVKGAMLVGILGATVVYWALSDDWPLQIFAPRFVSLHALDFGVLVYSDAWMQAGALLLMLLFSISGAVIGSARMAGLMREDGGVNGRTSVFVCCGAGTVVSGMLGSSPVFVSMSSAAGIRDGGRTGLVSVVIGVYSLLTAMLLTPLAAAVPHCAISPVLILIGVAMTGEAAEVHWSNIQDALPAFLCAVFQPFTYSVANGIYAGVGMSFVLFFTTGRFIAYMPCVRKQLAKCGSTAALRRQATPEENLAAQQVLMKRPQSLNSLAQPRKRMPRSHSEPDMAATEDVRGKLHTVGMGTTEKAAQFVTMAASLIGFDQEAAQRAFEERIVASRNVQGHLAGGVPGYEVDRLEDDAALAGGGGVVQ